MNRKLFLIVMSILLVTAVLVYMNAGSAKGIMASPGFTQFFGKPKIVSTPTPNPSAPNAPKTFQFSRSTDLKVELQKVDPKLLDSDFE